MPSNGVDRVTSKGEECGSIGPLERRVAIIGTGVVGTAIGIALSRRGYAVSGVADRTIDVARRTARRLGQIHYGTDVIEVAKKADFIFITTADDAIVPTCETIAAGGGVMRGDIFIHCSGALSSDALGSARDCGAFVASMHPVGVFADVETAVDQLPTLSYSLEGDDEAVTEAEIIVKKLGGTPLRVSKEEKVYLHIAACLTANYTVTLFDVALQVVRRLRFSKDEAVSVLLPLLKGAVEALEKNGMPGALTGPLARGDIHTIRRHIEAIHSVEELVRLYSLLGIRTLSIAREGGKIDEKTASRLKDILNESLMKSNRNPLNGGGDKP
ncbi:MAG: DUF2520 domain-containing protein [Gemmatimonadota bacterium]|nr:MAG: DUF2520 domain-containing protein [Gemmatimonadota bacterium]